MDYGDNLIWTQCQTIWNSFSRKLEWQISTKWNLVLRITRSPNNLVLHNIRITPTFIQRCTQSLYITFESIIGALSTTPPKLTLMRGKIHEPHVCHNVEYNDNFLCPVKIILYSWIITTSRNLSSKKLMNVHEEIT